MTTREEKMVKVAKRFPSGYLKMILFDNSLFSDSGLDGISSKEVRERIYQQYSDAEFLLNLLVNIIDTVEENG